MKKRCCTKIFVTLIALLLITGNLFGQSLEDRIIEYHEQTLTKRFPPEEVNIKRKVLYEDVNQDGYSDLLIDYNLSADNGFGATRQIGNGISIFTIKADSLHDVFDFISEGGGSTLMVYGGYIYRGNWEYLPPYDFESYYRLSIDENREKAKNGVIKDSLSSVVTSSTLELLRKFPEKFENYLYLPDLPVEWNYDLQEVYFDSKSYRFPIRGIDIGELSLSDKKIYSTISKEMAFELISDKQLYNSKEGALINLNKAYVFGKIVRNNYQGSEWPRYYFQIYQITTVDEYGNFIKKYERVTGQ